MVAVDIGSEKIIPYAIDFEGPDVIAFQIKIVLRRLIISLVPVWEVDPESECAWYIDIARIIVSVDVARSTVTVNVVVS